MARIPVKSAGIIALCAAGVTLLGIAPSSVGAQEGTQALSPATGHSDAPVTTRSLPIFYDQALAMKGFPNPLVKAQIARHEAIFIVDSGASVSILADWYVKAAGIPANKTGSVVTGASGKAAPARLVHRLRGQWSDGQRFRLGEAMVIAFPPYFESLHLGGLVSPQALAPAGMAAVLDLRVPSLRFVPYERALSELRQSTTPTAAIDLTPPCQYRGANHMNRLYSAVVKAAGATDHMLIDTGATGSIFSDQSNIAHAIGSGSELDAPSDAVGDTVTTNRIVRDVAIQRGGGTVTLSPDVGKSSALCNVQGRLGMDALRSCLLILGEKQMAFSCG